MSHAIEIIRKCFLTKTYILLLQKRFFKKLKDNFLLKLFLQHRKQEYNENILRYEPLRATFLINNFF
jgi:hypothetical protein